MVFGANIQNTWCEHSEQFVLTMCTYGADIRKILFFHPLFLPYPIIPPSLPFLVPHIRVLIYFCLCISKYLCIQISVYPHLLIPLYPNTCIQAFLHTLLSKCLHIYSCFCIHIFPNICVCGPSISIIHLISIAFCQVFSPTWI